MDEIKLTKLAECAGCGAKVGAGELSKLLEGLKVRQDPNLLVGYDRSDDASVYKLSDELALVQTVDFFPPIADDPYTFGAIAAANALSDVYAMGGEPKLALNVMAVPEDMPKEAVHAILRGGYEKAYEAGAIITGGHSIFDDEPKYGLSVTGFVHPDRILTNSGAKEGDVLLLTKPIGIGILTSAMKADLCSKESAELAMRLMTTLNKKSGVLGISGVSSDFRDLEAAAPQGNQRAQLALDSFDYNVKKLIGAYAAAMGGVDAIIFTAGVGENGPDTRANVVSGLEYMGVKLDAEKNNTRGKEVDVATDDSKVRVLVIPTNEELMIAMDTAAIVKA